jgi:GMP synthase-like glutamine amidotransferase
VIQHHQSAPGGHLDGWLEARGAAWDVYRIDLKARSIGLREWSVIVSLGSERAAYDHTIPWLQREQELLLEATHAGVPVLGICFGAQLLAGVLGGNATRSHTPEIGWRSVRTEDDSLITPGPWFQWHFDTFTAPPGARLIADSGAGPQAYVVGRSLGVQFHPEVTPEIVETWVRDDRLELDTAGVDPDLLLEETYERADRNRAAAWELFDAFLARARAAD